MNTTCILIAKDLQTTLDSSEHKEIDYIKVDTKGLAGEVMSSAAMITITTATLTALTKIIIELIRNKKEPKIKIKGKDFSFDSENLSQNEIIKIITKLSDDTK